MTQFEKIYLDKSGNEWGVPFQKKPGAFNAIEASSPKQKRGKYAYVRLQLC